MIRLDKNTDVEYIERRHQQWLERADASQKRLLGNQEMVFEEQTKPMNCIAYWVGLAMILAALTFAGKYRVTVWLNNGRFELKTMVRKVQIMKAIITLALMPLKFF
jgi:hypothetical protein